MVLNCLWLLSSNPSTCNGQQLHNLGNKEFYIGLALSIKRDKIITVHKVNISEATVCMEAVNIDSFPQLYIQ